MNYSRNALIKYMLFLCYYSIISSVGSFQMNVVLLNKKLASLLSNPVLTMMVTDTGTPTSGKSVDHMGSYTISASDKMKDSQSQKQSHSNNQYQGKLKGYNKYYYDNRKRQFETVLLVVRNQTRSRVAFTITDINHAITTAGRLNHISEAIEIFNSFKKLGFEADLMSYNNMIWAAGNVGDIDLASSIYMELKRHPQLRPNVYTFGSLMHGCAKVKAHERALSYLDEMTRSNVAPNQIVFTSAMEACADVGKYKEALAIMDRMKAFGMKPDLTMLNAAIKACCLAGAMGEAEELTVTLKDNNSMDLFTYHTLMMGHTKLGAYHKVMNLYEQAIESNTRLDGGVYSLAMLSALNCGSFYTVQRIADRAHAEKVPLTEASYTILVQALAELGESESAVRCLDNMVLEGLKPNTITYSAVIAAVKDRPDVVVNLLERMEKEGVTKNTVVMTAAINALARFGNEYVNVALKILSDMERIGPEPNIYTYNTVTRAFAESGRLDEAISVVERIRLKGLKPDRFTLTTLLVACGRTCNSTMVPKVIQLMATAGVPPDGIAFGAALDAHRRSGNSLGALECLTSMSQYRVEPTAAHYNLVIRSLKSEGYTDRMFKMVVGISQKEGAKINCNTFEIAIESLLEEDKWKEAMILVKSMDKLSFKPSLEVCVSLVEKLEKCRQYRSALALYRLMLRYGYDFYENRVLNGIFKRVVSVATLGIDLDLKKAMAEYFNYESSLEE